MNLQNKIILLTGATGHLGSAISECILKNHGTLIAVSRNIDNSHLKSFKHHIAYELDEEDLALHHCNLIHYAPINKSKSIRKSLAFRLNGVNAKIDNNMKKKYNLNLQYNRKK